MLTAKDIVVEELRRLGKLCDDGNPNVETSLISLGIDSITMITLLVSLESRFGWDIEEAIGEEPARTFGDLVDMISNTTEVASR